MKKIRSIAFLTTVLTALAITVSLFTSNNFVTDAINKNGSSSFQLRFNKDKNKFYSGTDKASGNATAITDNEHDVNFSYTNFQGGSDTWQIVPGDGNFYNSSAINGLESIVLSFKIADRSFKIYYSESTAFTEAKSATFTTSTSSSTIFNFDSYRPNYFKFVNTSGYNINISSMVLTYSCRSEYSTVAISSNNINKGTVSGNTGTFRNGTSITITASPYYGCSFLGWYEDETLITLEETYTFDLCYSVNYVAHFVGTTHTVSITNAQPSMGITSGEGIYEYGDEVTINASSYTGYNFTGWYVNNVLVSSLAEYTFIMGIEDVTYEARFEPIEYTISYNLNDGVNNPDNPSVYYINSDDIFLANPSKLGYSFVNWTDGDENVVTVIETGSYGNISLTANWQINTYQITVATEDENKGSVAGGGSYTYGSSASVEAFPTEGYALLGWYDGEGEVSKENPYVFTVEGDIALTAKFAKIYNITIISDDPSKGTVSGPTSCPVGSEVTVSARGVAWPYTLDYWRDDDYLELSFDSDFTFVMPARDVKYYATFKEDTTIRPVLLGSYPQSLVKKTAIISALDEISEVDEKGYKTYEGKKYYPYSGSSYTDNDGKIVSSGTHYYEVEQIEWNIISSDSTKALATTKYLLDIQQYISESYTGKETREEYQGDSASVYANNYKYSELRTFINTTFYDQAFDITSRILTTEVSNKTASRYSCENTNDKMFVLSEDELKNEEYGFASNGDRQCKTTEFARARGAYSSEYHYGYYWTRTTATADSTYVRAVSHDGKVYGSIVNNPTYSHCIRPAFTLSLA